MRDKSLRDLNRRPLEFNRSQVAEALPEHFTTEYPTLVNLLEDYYQYLDSDQNNFGYQLKDLATTRDIGQTAPANLTYIEDELLLGENYIEGVLDKRTGAELSNNFYRSKGSKFSVERFFRAFFGVDISIRYGKDLLFNIGETPIGTESGKFIQNDKLYQFWGLEIESPLSQSEWLELYKLFVHPGGMYIAASVTLDPTAGEVAVLDPRGFAYVNDVDSAQVSYVFEGFLAPDQFGETLALVKDPQTDIVYRQRPDTMRLEQWVDSDEYTLEQMGRWYSTIVGAADVATFTMDQDSADSGLPGLLTSMDVPRETADQDIYNYYDSA